MPLSPENALYKDRTNAKGDATTMQHRHFAVIARIVNDTINFFDTQQRLALALHFADELARTNPRFDRLRFLRACGVVS